MDTKQRLAAVSAFLLSAVAFAYGPWLEWTPLGGVEIDGTGLPRAELEQRLDEIERATADDELPGVIFALRLPKKMHHSDMVAQVSGLPYVTSIQEI